MVILKAKFSSVKIKLVYYENPYFEQLFDRSGLFHGECLREASHRVEVLDHLHAGSPSLCIPLLYPLE